ncbi:MAG: hypothetical protein ABFE07_12765 [Armatimonadia bacterium]
MSGDIVDRIDELVDQQLQQEPSGYDHNINQDKCWHCGREWHGLPITQRIAQMYARRTYDETYSLAEDDSPVLCRGSNFIGPMPRRAPSISAVTIGCDVDQVIEAASAFIMDTCRTIIGLPVDEDDEPADEPPTGVQFWDRYGNSLGGLTASDWEWGAGRQRARFTLGGTTVFAGSTNMTITTENPRRMWRVSQATQYREDNRIVVDVIDVLAELESIRALTEWPVA